MKKKMEIKILIAAFGLVIVVCIFVGRITSGSYIDNVELEKYLSNKKLKVEYCGMGYDPLTNRGYLDNDEIKSINDLMIGEDIIVVKAKIDSSFERKIYYECILSKIEIVDCYKGNLVKGDKVNVFEPVDCRFENQILCTDGYSMMQKDKEYILFLKNLKNTFYGTDKYVYAPSSTLYSKYAVDNETPKLFSYEELEEPENLHMYSQVKNQEVYLYDKEQFEKYLYLKDEVMKYLGR